MFVFKLPLPLRNTTKRFPPAPSYNPSTCSVVELVKQRDSYQSQHVCVVCGPATGQIPSVNVVRIISDKARDQSRWQRWKRAGYLPGDVQDSTVEEARNILSLCEQHQKDFFEHRFFLRWLTEADGYLFVDFRGPNSTPSSYHGQKVFLSQTSPLAPLPFLLLTHEAEARARWPTFSENPISPLIQPTFPFTTPKTINLPTKSQWHGLVPQQIRAIPAGLHLLNVDDGTMTLSFPSFPLISFPDAYMHDSKTLSSCNSAFNTVVGHRDLYKQQPVCVVCGGTLALRHVHIIGRGKKELWELLHRGNLVPSTKTKSIKHDPRNGILLCASCHYKFNHLYFYLRLIPEEQKVILVNHSRHPEISKYHGKAVWVKMDSDFAPSATLFLLHEACVRAFWCTTGDRPLPFPIVYQDAFLEADTAREEEGDDGDGYRGNGRNDESTEEEDGPTTSRKTLDRNETVGQVPSSGFYTLSWNPVQLQHVISSARQLPTWKQSLVENESWEGTAEENIEKYRTLMISGDDSNPHQVSSIAPAD